MHQVPHNCLFASLLFSSCVYVYKYVYLSKFNLELFLLLVAEVVVMVVAVIVALLVLVRVLVRVCVLSSFFVYFFQIPPMLVHVQLVARVFVCVVLAAAAGAGVIKEGDG